MANRWKQWVARLPVGDKRIRVLVALGAIGMALLLLSEWLPAADTAAKQKEGEENYTAYTQTLEKKTTALISSIEGVGRCSVMITLKDTNESIYAKNNEENSSDSSYSRKNEYVLYDGQGGDSPLLIKQYFPAVQGVAIVCDGAENTVVRENIINSVAALFDISVSKISVSKYKV